MKILLSILFSFLPCLLALIVYTDVINVERTLRMLGIISITIWPICTLTAIFVAYREGECDGLTLTSKPWVK